MRGVRLCDDGIRVVEVDEPDAQEGTLVSIRAAGICGSDFDYIQMGCRNTLGHELSGLTEDGRAVAMEGLWGCGACDRCRSGAYNWCQAAQARSVGFGRDGGMADRLAVPAMHLVELPEGLRVEDACLVEPLGVGMHGLRLAGAGTGMRVGVIGGGSIGLLAAAGALSLGCEVAVNARHAHQLEAAEAIGAGRHGKGDEYDVVVEAAGNESALGDAIDMLAPGGQLVVLGVYHGGLPLPITTFLKEAVIRNSLGYCHYAGGRDIEDSAALLAARPELAEALITHRFPLDEATRAFEVAADRKAGAIKVVLEP